jgi:hypothetical protein
LNRQHHFAPNFSLISFIRLRKWTSDITVLPCAFLGSPLNYLRICLFSWHVVRLLCILKPLRCNTIYVTNHPNPSTLFCDICFIGWQLNSTVTKENGLFWDVTPCGSCKNRRFRETWRLLHQGDRRRQRRNFFTAYVGCYLQLVLFLVHRFLSP